MHADSLAPVAFEDACSFLQSWLFFGLLESTGTGLLNPVDVDVFVKGGAEGERYISTAALPEVILRWALIELDDPYDRETFYAYRFGLLALRDQLGMLTSVKLHCEDRGRAMFHDVELDDAQFDIASKVLQSIYCLAETLNTLLMLNGINAPMPVGMTPSTRERMKHSGYCSAAIAHIETSINSPSCLYFISNIKSAWLEGHGGCSSSICNRSTLDDDSYIRAHTADCDPEHCDDICVEDFRAQAEDERPVSRILQDNEIPVMSVDCTTPSATIRVLSTSNKTVDVESKSVIPYVAISHVWSEWVNIAFVR